MVKTTHKTLTNKNFATNGRYSAVKKSTLKNESCCEKIYLQKETVHLFYFDARLNINSFEANQTRNFNFKIHGRKGSAVYSGPFSIGQYRNRFW
jgi:hypothetical protein